MNMKIKDVESATICPYRLELAKTHQPAVMRGDGYQSRAAHVLDMYYANFTAGRRLKRSRLKDMFAEYVEEHYREEGGDQSWKRAEQLAFDRFIDCVFVRVEASAEVLPRMPQDLPIDYGHSVSGFVDAIVETQRRPRMLNVVLYANAPVHGHRSNLSRSFRLMFYKLTVSDLYSNSILQRATFQIYDLVEPAIFEVPFSKVNAAGFPDMAGRIATATELGLLHPCIGKHCAFCRYAPSCRY